MQSADGGGPALLHARVLASGGGSGFDPDVGEGPRRSQGGPELSFCDLTEALRDTGVPDEGTGSSAARCCGQLTPTDGPLHDVFAKLKGKWAAEATRYRLEHPEALPPTKPGRCTLLLPIERARELMRTWIPWALLRIQEDFARLARRYDTLSPEQVAAIDAV